MDGVNTATAPLPSKLLGTSDIATLIAALAKDGYQVLGPVRRDGAIVYDEIDSPDDFPAGWTDEQGPGTYRLKKRGDDAWFGYVVGPHSWKRYLHEPVLRLWSAQRRGQGGFDLDGHEAPPCKMAFVGVRACELAAIARQDRILRDGPFADAAYVARRRSLFVVAVNCANPASTCFCASMGTGPAVASGYDIALTELLDDGRHVFVADAGTEAGAVVLGAIDAPGVSEEDRAAAVRVSADAESRLQRRIDTAGLRETLMQNFEHAQYDNVAERCLTCGCCTMACPTCFCTTVEDTSDLTATRTERWRKWDSCFSVEFSYLYGGSVRTSPRSRYRQWLTHKLATWWDQFGVSGCVGCGRCITWCPVGIDITNEARAIQETGASVAAGNPSEQEPTHGDGRTAAR